jgi:DNA-binding IclR family transcriptional regulator
VEKARKSKAERTPSAVPKAQRGIQSLETGGAILRALAAAVEPMKLRDLADAVGIGPSKLHPYLVSLRKIGIVEQTDTGRYALGPLALQLGLSRLRGQDAFHEAIRRVPALGEETRLMVAISAWGLHGATIVYVRESTSRVHANVRPGGIFMTTLTATGRLFAAFHTPDLTEPVIQSELAEIRKSQSASYGIDELSFRRRVEIVRRQGYETTMDVPIPGVSAIAAPVFDHSGAMELAITLIGPTPVINLEPEGPAVTCLLAFSEQLSEDLGYQRQPLRRSAG